LIIFGVLALIAISFSEYLVKFLQEPYIANGKKLITTRPTGAFMTRFRIALMSALILALPFTLHQLWLFVFPALTGKLKKMGLPLLIFSTLLFWGGIIFNYLFVLPMVMKAFQDMIWPGVEIAYNIDDYYDFISMTSIVFGVIFEMPVVVLLFVRMGFLTHRFLLKQWRYSLVIGAVIAAILTPPDAFSQTMMLIPMILLYLISILIAYIFRKRDID
jgi:sec-independent protein translocase protein TatC